MIIGFHGCKGTGKDTAGQFLVDTYDFTKVAFADPLKEAVANLFDIDLEDVAMFKDASLIDSRNDYLVSITQLGTSEPYVSWTWREFLQRFGTEMGRNTFGQNFWVDQWEDYLYRNSIVGDNIVVTDVRFKNEAEKIQHMHGTVVRITRSGYEPDGHESEEPLPNILIDAEINNTGTLDDLRIDIHELYKEIERRGGIARGRS